MPSSDILIDYSYLGPGGNIAGAATLLILCIGAVAGRFWGRSRSHAGFKSDDWLVLISLVLFMGMAICIFVGVAKHALGYPTPKPPAGSPADEFLFFTSPEEQLTGKMEQIVIWLQMWQLGCAKASVVMFYRRVFSAGTLKRWFQISTIALLALISLWTVIFFFIWLFVCGTNFSANWTTVIRLEDDCQESQLKQMALAICDFATDVFIICLPLPIIWKLHMSLGRKIGVSAVFLLGALAVAASCLRMAIYIIVDVSFINPKQDGDRTVNVLIFWAVIESGLSILAATLPSLAFLGQKVGPLQNAALRSLRSVFSLQSIRSRTSSGHTRNNNQGERRTSADSQIHMTPINKQSSNRSHSSGVRDEDAALDSVV